MMRDAYLLYTAGVDMEQLHVTADAFWYVKHIGASLACCGNVAMYNQAK